MQAGGCSFRIEGLAEGFECSLASLPEKDPGVTDIEVRFTADEPATPAPTTLAWRVPMDRVHFKWNPACGENRFLDVFTGCKNSFKSRGIDHAPVMGLYDISGTNALTFALSDAMHESELGIHVGEDGLLTCRAKLFCEPWDRITDYSVVLRIDRRRLPYHVCLRDAAAWWDGLIEAPPAPVPDAARVPLYCTWYAYHGDITAAEIEKQCALAKELGMEVLLVDAGWATGDYEPNADKFPDFREHVRTVHAAGMKFILWTSPSSTNPVAAERFGDKVLVSGKTGKRRLDPRYPDVRRYIADTYERLVREYDLDGFKIDFISSFGRAPDDEPDDARRDQKSVSVAVDRLLHDTLERLRSLKPDILIEFRQSYVGPHMRRHANMLRAVDCGNCFADNRIRVLDIRLLSGRSAVHADPIMWNPAEPVESAAMQLTHTMFAVPQISVKLDELPRDHIDMIRCYLRFWTEHRDVLLDGELVPLEPQAGYPLVLSSTKEKLLAAVYGSALVSVPTGAPGTLVMVNGTYADHVVLEAAGALGARRLTVFSCTGEQVCDRKLDLPAGLHRIEMPPNGYATLRAT
jgi:alpha-galactosidase